MEYTYTSNLNFTAEINSLKINEDYTDNINNNQNQNNNETLNVNNNSKRSYDSNESGVQINMKDPENIEEIQNITFPDKVIMQNTTYSRRNSELPKLDMSKVYQKYQSHSNVHIIKQNKKKDSILNNTNSNLNIHLMNNSELNNQLAKHGQMQFNNSNLKNKNTIIAKNLNNKINTLKNEINQNKGTLKDLESNLEKIKKTYKENKNKYTKIKENLKIADTKIELLKNQIKQYSHKGISEYNLEVIKIF